MLPGRRLSHARTACRAPCGVLQVTPDPKHLLVLTLLMSVPTFVFMLGFTAQCFGIPVYVYLVKNEDAGSAGIGLAAFIALCVTSSISALFPSCAFFPSCNSRPPPPWQYHVPAGL